MIPEGRTYSPPEESGGGIPSFGQARALSEGDAASAEADGRCGQAPFVHAVGRLLLQGWGGSCHSICQLPAETCHRQLSRSYGGIVTADTPIFSFAKEKQKKKERTQRITAIYHLEAKVISRGTGRSACAAAAYMSCSAILNEYDGIWHDYTRKQGLVWQQVFLPHCAPPEWSDRSALWNAVEENEKTKDSRLARELVVALPIELSHEKQIELISDFVKDQFIADGMCVDAAIHDTDGHNPHAHIMLTVRPLDEHGKWQYKTEKEYLCVRDGEEKGFTSSEFLSAQDSGWEKQYQYKVGKKKVYMTPSQAEAQGLERVSKYPKSTKYGRQNPISARWNSDEQLILWRKAWADTTNLYLERAGADARIDHRSNAERGLDEQPTIHEGVTARAMEAKGLISDRCEINRQIKADNALLRELKAQAKKLMDAAKNTIPVLAEKLETLRQNMIIFRYQLLHIAKGKSSLISQVDTMQSDLTNNAQLVRQIKEKFKERKILLAQKKSTPVFHVVKYRELSQRIAELSEDIEELKSEKATLLRILGCDEEAMAGFRKGLVSKQKNLMELEQQEQKCTSELDLALQEYRDLEKEAQNMNSTELKQARFALRQEMEEAAAEKLQEAYAQQYDPDTMSSAKRDISKLLNEEAEDRSVWNRLQRQQSPQQRKTTEEPDWER